MDTTDSFKSSTRKSDRFATVVLQLAVAFLLGSAAFLLAYSYSARPTPAKVQWKPKASVTTPARVVDLASLLQLLPAVSNQPDSPPDPPQAFFQSIEQDLAPWNMTGISYDHVRFLTSLFPGA